MVEKGDGLCHVHLKALDELLATLGSVCEKLQTEYKLEITALKAGSPGRTSSATQEGSFQPQISEDCVFLGLAQSHEESAEPSPQTDTNSGDHLADSDAKARSPRSPRKKVQVLIDSSLPGEKPFLDDEKTKLLQTCLAAVVPHGQSGASSNKAAVVQAKTGCHTNDDVTGGAGGKCDDSRSDDSIILVGPKPTEQDARGSLLSASSKAAVVDSSRTSGAARMSLASLITATSNGETPEFELRSTWDIDISTLDRITSRAAPTQGLDWVKQGWLKKKVISRAAKPWDPIIGDEEYPWLPLHPQSQPRLLWELLAVVVLTYDFVVMPLAAFNLPDHAFLYTMDAVVVVYWTFDMVMSSITGFYRSGKLQMAWRRIWLRYMKTWLFFDIVVLLPEWLSLFSKLEDGENSGIARAMRGSRVTRLLRFCRLLRMLKAGKLLDDLKARVNSPAGLLFITIFRLLLTVVMVIHVLASAWYFIGEQSHNGWVYVHGIHLRSLGDRYIYTFQWSLARLHPSSFDKNDSLEALPDRLFGILVSLGAVGGGGYFVSYITNTMNQLETLRKSRTRQVHLTREYVRVHGISMYLAMRVKTYVEKSGSQKVRVAQAKELATFLPLSLTLDLRFEAWTPLISAHPFFMHISARLPRVVWRMCKDALSEVAVLADDTVFTNGDSAEKMFFVVVGEMSYVKGREMGVGARGEEELVKVGQWLSEPVLWTIWEHRGELLGYSDCVLLAMSAREMLQVAESHEKAAAEISSYARRYVALLNQQDSEFLTDLLPADFSDPCVKYSTSTYSKTVTHNTIPQSALKAACKFKQFHSMTKRTGSTGRVSCASTASIA
eukprot:TRINITY_DN14137_c0_g1_i1.p1 TRINITY_DN14137_c0_g1~~TRINITY_DN14137_c0_g1_i1.p1  ORF type:complete len:835 (+),score=113.57 TRINITY_DN14137_c0_g1_i1:50-2554(+)